MLYLRNTICIAITSFFFLIAHGQEEFPKVQVLNELGERVNLQDYVKEGGPKIVNLWATWCGPCRMELNALKKIAPTWKDKYNLEIITVSMDIPRMVTKAKEMAKQNDWKFTFMYDGVQDVASKLKINSLPYSWLINEEGDIISVMVGYSPNYEQHIEQKLRG